MAKASKQVEVTGITLELSTDEVRALFSSIRVSDARNAKTRHSPLTADQFETLALDIESLLGDFVDEVDG
jgi:hypothetical protein